MPIISDSHGTVRANLQFDDGKTVDILEKAIVAANEAEKANIYKVLTQINNAQRQMLRTPYKTKYKKDLVDELSKTLNGHYRDVVMALMQTPAKFDAIQLHTVIIDVVSVGAKEAATIELLCSRNNSELLAIKNEYQNAFKRSLEADLTADTSEDYKHILKLILSRPLETNNNTMDVAKIKQYVQRMFADNNNKQPNNAVMKEIIPLLQPQQLLKLFDEYEVVAGHPIERDIEKVFSGEAKKLMLALVYHARNPSLYFAHLIHKSMKGAGARHCDLIRSIVSRSEIDLVLIREIYHSTFKKTLMEWIHGECKDLYRDCMIAIVRGNF